MSDADKSYPRDTYRRKKSKEIENTVQAEQKHANIPLNNDSKERLDERDPEHSRQPRNRSPDGRRMEQKMKDGGDQNEWIKRLLARLDGEPKRLVREDGWEPERLAEK